MNITKGEAGVTDISRRTLLAAGCSVVVLGLNGCGLSDIKKGIDDGMLDEARTRAYERVQPVLGNVMLGAIRFLQAQDPHEIEYGHARPRTFEGKKYHQDWIEFDPSKSSRSNKGRSALRLWSTFENLDASDYPMSPGSGGPTVISPVLAIRGGKENPRVGSMHVWARYPAGFGEQFAERHARGQTLQLEDFLAVAESDASVFEGVVWPQDDEKPHGYSSRDSQGEASAWATARVTREFIGHVNDLYEKSHLG